MWSALITGAIALTGSLIKAGVAKRTAENMAKAKYDMTEAQAAEYDRAKMEVYGLWDSYSEMGERGLNELADFDSDILMDREDFTYDKTVDDFMNPYQDFVREQAMNDLEHTASLGGSGLGSGGTMKALQDRSHDLSTGYYNTAHDQKTADEKTKYGYYTDKWTRDKDALTMQYDQIMDKVDLGTKANIAKSNAAGGFATSMADVYNTQGNINADRELARGTFANNIVNGAENAGGMAMAAYDMYEPSPHKGTDPDMAGYTSAPVAPAGYGQNPQNLSTKYAPSQGNLNNTPGANTNYTGYGETSTNVDANGYVINNGGYQGPDIASIYRGS